MKLASFFKINPSTINQKPLHMSPPPHLIVRHNGVLAERKQSGRYENGLTLSAGFTLVELAIVIVIVGLLVGGVLQGQELIQQANVKSQVSQIAEFDAAVATFKSKYNYLPGDLDQVNANMFGFTYEPSSRATSLKLNGVIDSTMAWDESYFVFIHLSEAKLIKDRLFLESGGYSVGRQFPRAKLGDGGVAGVSVSNGVFGYFFGPSIKQSSGNPQNWTSNSLEPTLTPEQSLQLDLKLDDGKPDTGILKAVTLTFATDTTTSNCLGSTVSEYNLTTTNKLCRITIKSVIN
jgi:prepilin-type N-terminal cleavage/methylation domain-containing protein